MSIGRLQTEADLKRFGDQYWGRPEKAGGTSSTAGAWKEVGAVGQPSFVNGWVNFGGTHSTAAFYKKDERVWLRGVVKSGTVGQLVFTLPVGFRPAGREFFAVLSNDDLGRVDVHPDGGVQVWLGSNVYVQLDGITFRVA